MLKPGDVVGRFTLERELGRGPMSEVFFGVERATGWKVAFKVFLIEPGSRPADQGLWAQRMVREASAAAQFRHENVVCVHEVGVIGAIPYLVRDFIVGNPLTELIPDRSPGALERKVRWLRDLAFTLAEIHRAGLVHRDVKPSNVLIRRDGAVRVLDFGVARRSVDRESGLVAPVADRPTSGPPRPRVVGTPAYLAPERFAHHPTSPPADQFGWGVVAYELIAGHIPWGEGKRLRPIRMIDAILNHTPRPLRTFAPALPARFDAIVSRTMAKAPGDRFPTMDEVFRAIDDAVR